jgi:hypothetical protein
MGSQQVEGSHLLVGATTFRIPTGCRLQGHWACNGAQDRLVLWLL